MKNTIRLALAALALCAVFFSRPAPAADAARKKIVLLAGPPSHGPGEHEHNAGMLLFKKCLAAHPGVEVVVCQNGEWPAPEVLQSADAVVIYSDGGGGHMALSGDRLEQLAPLMKKGAGLGCVHYAVEPTKEKGEKELVEWIGGAFEVNWSVNPQWEADFKTLPQHAVTRGVKPFKTSDEWYFNMRFRDGMKGVTPILSAIAPASTMSRKDGAHEGNPAVRESVAKGEPQTVMWVAEREGGGRGFGFTGGHFHTGWGNADQRKLMLNAILWIAHVDVPANGFESTVTEDDLKQNLDPKGQKKTSAAPHAGTGAKPVAATPVVHAEPVAINAELKGAKEIYLVVTDAGDGFECDWADWIEPTFVKADGTRIKLTELKPKSAQVGFGNLGMNKNAGGGEMKVKNQPVAFGLGAHAPSMVVFDVPEGVVAFEGKGVVDDGGIDQGKGGTVVFQLYTANPGDKPLASSEKKSNPSTKPYGVEAAKEMVKTMVTPPGLEASLFAAEPMIQNPTNISIDQRGRVWAVECLNYRKYMNTRPEGDRVVILEDTDGDGLADRETTFFQDKRLTNPLGICVLPTVSGKGTQVIVSAAPNVWLLTDTDGDGKADKEQILFKVGGVWNYDHQVHAFVFGSDGKFYFNGGNSVTELFWPDGTIVKDVAGNAVTGKGKPYRQGMVFRCDLDLATGKASNVETLAWNFRNNYEVAVDSFGTLWQSDNDDDGNKGVRINYVMEFGNYGYTDEKTGAGWQSKRTNIEEEIPKRHWHLNDPGVVPNLLQTGAGSPTGILVNEGSLLGAQFQNQIIHCDAGPRVVRAYPVENDGAGYKATSVDILTAPNEDWYRPSDCAIAPDGSLFVADWFDSHVGGHGMNDNNPATIRGRIYRVAPTGVKLTVPKLDFSTAAGCAAALQSPNMATQFVSWQNLNAMGGKATGALGELFAKNPNPRVRARALQLLAHIKGSEKSAVAAGIRDKDANLRIVGLRIARELNIDVIPTVKALVKDPSPQVRRECAIALRHSESTEAPALWTQLALQHDGHDRWYLEALGIGADRNEAKFFDAWLAAVGSNWNTPAGRDIVWRSRAPRAPALLVKIITDAKTTEADRPRYIRALDFISGPEKDAALLEMATGALDQK